MTQDWATKLLHPDVMVPDGFRSLSTPVFRGSTTLFTSADDIRYGWDPRKSGYTYGVFGTPTTLELAARISALEGGRHTFLTPGGQSAIALIYFATVKPGDHVLITDSIYGPHRRLALNLLKTLQVEVEFYRPDIGAKITELLRPQTRLIWCESPGSVTLEVQDVPAICAAARRHGALVALDNTYAAGVLFDPFAAGVDISMQALTKYVSGHGDVLLGSVTLAEDALVERIGAVHDQFGMAVSPDDCSLTLRGLQTLAVRLRHIEHCCLEVARWLECQPGIGRVLHPALASHPGHAIWKRDFNGSSGTFAIEFDQAYSAAAINRFVDALRLFKIGYSWGGTTSLVMPYHKLDRSHDPRNAGLVRFGIGLENAVELIADLSQALTVLR